MSGGWAAKELTEKGLKTLVLERGQMVRHPEYPTALKDPWELPYGNRITQETRKRKYVWSRTGYPTPANELWFTDDLDNPYIEERPFDWLRAYHVGGRSMHWARQSYRFSPMDFEANAREGVAIPWPVSYEEIAPWYDKVETFAGISGSIEGLPQLPDGKFLPPHDLNCVEIDFKKTLADKLGRKLIIGRCANLTAPLTHNESPQRGTCQARNMCIRGCPYGAYFSSVSATLPSAERTGNMTLLADKIVYEVIYDNDKGRASGVRVLDSNTGKQTDYFAKIDQYAPFIEEAHHSRKRDAPSGTALRLGEFMKERYERDIPISSTRAGYIPGTHRVGFDSEADQVLLTHTARSRQGFASGALLAAHWIIGRKGMFEFGEVVDEIVSDGS